MQLVTFRAMYHGEQLEHHLVSRVGDSAYVPANMRHLARFPIGWNHLIGKKARKIKIVERVVAGT